MDEVNVRAADFRAVMREAIEARFLRTPVVAIAPVLEQVA